MTWYLNAYLFSYYNCTPMYIRRNVMIINSSRIRIHYDFGPDSLLCNIRMWAYCANTTPKQKYGFLKRSSSICLSTIFMCQNVTRVLFAVDRIVIDFLIGAVNCDQVWVIIRVRNWSTVRRRVAGCPCGSQTQKETQGSAFGSAVWCYFVRRTRAHPYAFAFRC